MNTAKRRSAGRSCTGKGERKRGLHPAVASTCKRHYLAPEDFEVLDRVETFPIETYLRGSWCSAETDIDIEDSR